MNDKNLLMESQGPTDPNAAFAAALAGQEADGFHCDIDPKTILKRVETLYDTPDHAVSQKYPANQRISTMIRNWGTDMATLLAGYRALRKSPHDMRPTPDIRTWDLRLLAMLAILSDMLKGQGHHVAFTLDTCVLFRSSDPRSANRAFFVVIDDVQKTIKDLSDMLGNSEAAQKRMEKAKKAKEDQRRRRAEKTKKEKAANAALGMGSEAASAAAPSKMKPDVDMLTRKLEKSLVSERMDEEMDEDE
ncbi:hypothetical protein K505DRAFT_355520 [Melanomma pulvis-pyrius CBS 109.77]|uniref:Uncharacterized protein n=1 Tax=Melanomma pulvis-pyrius CBS 109.77 TaxID=1314802 RepID=A0A6A6XWC5_9PLEO|nr:hypothetical protein K505DRAFT_355520 [Melanomma pulvis-pyrius CBS 109.77]